MRLVLLLCLIGLSGCSGLVLKKHNSIPTKVAKVFTRFVIVWPTLGISEMEIADARDEYAISVLKKEADDIIAYLAYTPIGEVKDFDGNMQKYRSIMDKIADIEPRSERRWERLRVAGMAMQGVSAAGQAVTSDLIRQREEREQAQIEAKQAELNVYRNYQPSSFVSEPLYDPDWYYKHQTMWNQINMNRELQRLNDNLESKQ